MPARRFYTELTDGEVRTLLERPVPTDLCEYKWHTDGAHEHSCSKKADHEKNLKVHVCLCGMVLP